MQFALQLAAYRDKDRWAEMMRAGSAEGLFLDRFCQLNMPRSISGFQIERMNRLALKLHL